MPDALVERDGPLMIVTMNRPHRMNAQSGAMIVRMYDAWVEASNDDEIRRIIVTGADGNFSSGADLKAMAGDSGPHADTGIDSAARLAKDPRLMHKAYLKDYRPTKPVIAAVEGVAIAGGTVAVTYSLTSMGCPAGAMIQEQMQQVVSSMEGVENVVCDLTWTPPWSPEMMSDDAKFVLGF